MSVYGWSTCRFCKEYDEDRVLIKYGVRHYAHTLCFFEARGLHGLLALPAAQADRVTPLVLPPDACSAFLKYWRSKS